MGRGTNSTHAHTPAWPGQTRRQAGRLARTQQLTIVADHPAVDPSPQTTRWLQVPGWPRYHAVSVEEIPASLIGQPALEWRDLWPWQADDPQNWPGITPEGRLQQAIAEEDRYIAWYTPAGSWTRPATGPTPQAAIDAALRAAAAEHLTPGPIPDHTDWQAQLVAAEREITERVGRRQRRAVWEEIRGKRVPEPVSHGQIEVIADDFVDYHDDGEDDEDGHSFTYHRYEPTGVRLTTKLAEHIGPRFFNDAPDKVFVVIRTYDDTDYERWSEDGNIEILGVFNGYPQAEDFTRLQAGYCTHIDDEITITTLPFLG